ncbi:MAG: hypothetical protein ACC645_25750 [Pirellulales bacterium]
MRYALRALPALAAVTLILTPGVTEATVVLAPPGTVGTVADAWSATDPGTAGWFYGDIRATGTVGTTTTYDRTSGEAAGSFPASLGSLEYNLSGSADKAGFNQYFATPWALSDLDGAGYDWYRDSSSTNSNVQAPALFFQFDSDGDTGTGGDTYGIKYEPIYNGVGPVMPTDAWQTAAIGGTTNLWSWNAPGDTFDFGLDLNYWKSTYPSAVVTWMGVDTGSGWAGQFTGAVDFVIVDRTGTANDQFFDFQVVPEPSRAVLFAMCLAGVGLVRRRAHPRAVA